jgi:hypothetical protein
MRHFVYIIGTTDDFESLEDLKNTYFNGEVTDRNMSVFTFDVPTVGTNSLTVHDIATYIGCGLAFSNDWCMDGTLSCLLEA